MWILTSFQCIITLFWCQKWDNNKGHAATAQFMEAPSPHVHREARAVHPHWLRLLPPGQPANSSLISQRPGPARQRALLVELHH